MSKLSNNHPASIMAALACVIAACGSSDGDVTSVTHLAPAEFGTVTIPLVTRQNDVFYRFGGTFTYSGASEGSFSQNPSDTVQYAVLAPGDYEVRLSDEWTLRRQAIDEEEATPIEAELVSANPRPIHVVSGVNEILTYVFSTEGTAVSIEPGTVQAAIDVLDQSNFDESIFGSILLDAQAQVDAYTGVQTFSGGVTITGAGITSLAALEQSSTFQSALKITATGLGSLAGLNDVSTTGFLGISNNPSLTSLSDLESLSSTGDISITNNPSLPTCEAEALIAHITETNGGSTGNVEISGNDDSATCP